MTVKYKTEGKLPLPNNSTVAPTAVVMWEVDGQHVRLVSDKHTITLSQSQFAELAKNFDTIWNDIGPEKYQPMPSGPANGFVGVFVK